MMSALMCAAGETCDWTEDVYKRQDIKDIIEKLSNDETIPYIGIQGIDVTEEIANQGIPEGVYVKEVDAESPAMAAGIQAGDIITSIGGEEVKLSLIHI